MIDNSSICSPRYAKKTACDARRKVLLDFSGDVCSTGLMDIAYERLANRLSFFGKSFAKASFQKLIQRKVDENTKQAQERREQSRVPYGESETNRPRIHADSSAAITYPTPRTVRMSFW